MGYAQNDNTPTFYANAGFNMAKEERFGGQFGLSALKNSHTLHLQLLFNSEVLSGLFGEKEKIETVNKIKTLSLMYGYAIHLKFLRIIPSIGITLNDEKYRTEQVDSTWVSSSGFLFGGSYEYEYKHYYEENLVFGGKISIKFFIRIKEIGLGVEPYLNIYNTSRISKGISVNMVFGKYFKETF